VWCAAAILGFSALALADWQNARLLRYQALPREPIAHTWHQAVLRAIGLGGCGQQPREVFLALDDPSTFQQAKLLGGATLEPNRHRNPIESFLDWLTEKQPRLLARAIVQQTWDEYFASTAANADEESILRGVARQNVMDGLAEELIARRWSLRHLHSLILNSEFYQRSAQAAPRQTGSVSAAGDDSLTFFVPRRLSAEQLVAAVDVLRPVAADFDTRMLPAGGTIFDVGARFPWGDDFAGRAFRLMRHDGGSRPFSLEAAMLLLVDSSWLNETDSLASWLTSTDFRNLSREEKIDHLFLAAYCRHPTEIELTAIVDELASIESDDAAVKELLWALVNSSEFQFLY
ncbi:MAG TPA: DUF1553 domain-containing protein, partial [Pirellulaceae bacterium]|nr:DUF1553 domain-containing protein [Pirellulaceae bacterium]